jgi:GDPmannose 4,6-dehydratase
MGDARLAKEELGWSAKIAFPELVRIMVDADLEKMGLTSPGKGRAILEKNFASWHHWEHQAISMDEH